MNCQDVFYGKKLTDGAKRLYRLLLDRQRESGDGYTTASLNELCRWLEVSKPTIIRYKRALAMENLIKESAQRREDGGDDKNRFEVLEPKIHQKNSDGNGSEE